MEFSELYSTVLPANVRTTDAVIKDGLGLNKRNTGGELGKNQFLQLLAAQMQYQDPLEPQKDTAFVAQLAQFTSLQQMQELNANMSLYQSYGMVGRYAAAMHTNTDFTQEELGGIVNAVYSKNGETYALLVEPGKDPATEGREVKTSEIYGVTDAPATAASDSSSSNSVSDSKGMLEMAQLIGLIVRGAQPMTDADGNAVTDAKGLPVPTTFEGAVTGVSSRGGKQYALISGVVTQPKTEPFEDMVDGVPVTIQRPVTTIGEDGKETYVYEKKTVTDYPVEMDDIYDIDLYSTDDKAAAAAAAEEGATEESAAEEGATEGEANSDSDTNADTEPE
jgi:flagellar hook assembly protein FlgD